MPHERLEQISSFLNELKISVHNDLSIQVCCRRASGPRLEATESSRRRVRHARSGTQLVEDGQLVDVAPEPQLVRFRRSDERVPSLLEVRSRVPIR